MDWKQLASEKPTTAYSIYCGVLEYSKEIQKEVAIAKEIGFNDWEIHENPFNQTSDEIVQNFNKFYYESYVNTVFPNISKNNSKAANPRFAAQTHRLSLTINTVHDIEIGKSKTKYPISFNYLDLFFFPDGVVYYCFKCDLSDYSFDEITLINNDIRNAGNRSDMDFINSHLSFLIKPDDSNDSPIFAFGNKLKLFTIIEHNLQLTEEEENMLLYDIGSCSPIGSASGLKPAFQPSKKYFSELIEDNKISVFNNWSALALFDTFTGLFQKDALFNFNWENGYFNLIYLQALYVKNHLFKVNKAFYTKEANHQKLDDELFEFTKYYNPSHISFNFLPNIIYKKVRTSLAINNELDQLKDRIERANQKLKEKTDKMINDVLTIIAFLAVFSAIWDLTEWINKLIHEGTSLYITLSGSLTIIILSVVGIFLYKNIRKNKR